MKQTNKKISYIFFAAAASLTALSSLFLIFALKNEYDSTIGHFKTAALFAPGCYLTLGVAFVLGIVYAIIMRKSKNASDKSAGIFSCFASAFSAFLVVAALVLDSLENTKELESSVNWESSFDVLEIVSTLYSIFAIGTAVALVLYAVKAKYSGTAAKFLAFCPIIYCAAQTLVLYFDKTIAVNGSIKILTQLAYISLMLMFTTDAGIAVEKPGVLPRHLMCCLWASVMCGTIAISALAAQFMGFKYFEITLADTCLLSAFFLLSLSKLWHAAGLITEDEEELIDDTTKETDF